jgi:iron complex outermembrane receptor protein
MRGWASNTIPGILGAETVFSHLPAPENGMRGLLVIAVAAMGLGAATAGAQTVDYAGLEAMFGGPVTTSATGSPQLASDAPVNMEIITADDIRRSGAGNIPDILRYVAGVDVRRYGYADADVSIRGYNMANSPRLLVLLNGRQIYVDFYGYTAWSTLPVQLAEIRQIEVIKGPNSALYGFNAVGGVINIVTMDPIRDSINAVDTRIGAPMDHQLAGVGTLHLGDNAGLRISAGEHGAHEVSASQLTPSFGPYPSHDYSRNAYLHGRAILPVGIDVTTEADFTESKLLEMAVGGYPAPLHYRTDREKLGIGGESAIGYLNLNTYRNWVGYRYLAGFNCQSCTNIDNALVVVQASDLMKPHPDHSVRVGLEYRDNRVTGSIFRGEKLGMQIYAGNAMWNWRVNDWLTLTNSARYDYATTSFDGQVSPLISYTAAQYRSSTFSEPSFNSAAMIKPTSLDTIRASVARGVQIPSFLDLFPQPIDHGFQVGAGTTSLQGTPNLAPTVVMNYELDYDRAIPEINSKAQLALYYQTSRNILAAPGDSGLADGNISTDPAVTATSGNNYAGNVGDSRAVGGELSLKGADPSGLRWKAAYALALIEDHFLRINRDLSNPDSSTDHQRGAPVHSVILGLGKTWGPIEADLMGRWQSRFQEMRLSDDATAMSRITVKDYIHLSGRLGYALTDGITLAVSGDQLMRSRLATTAGAPLDRRVFASTSFRF